MPRTRKISNKMKKKKKKTNRCQYQDELLELSKIFKAAMIKMLR